MSDIRLVIDSTGYDGVIDMYLRCLTCDQGLMWPGDRPLEQPIDGWAAGDLVAVAKVLAELTGYHGPRCSPKPPPAPEPSGPRWAGRAPVINREPEPVLGERRIKLGGAAPTDCADCNRYAAGRLGLADAVAKAAHHAGNSELTMMRSYLAHYHARGHRSE